MSTISDSSSIGSKKSKPKNHANIQTFYDNLATTFNAQSPLLKGILHSYVVQFAEAFVEKMNAEVTMTRREIIDLWNSQNVDFNVRRPKNPKKEVEVEDEDAKAEET